MSDSDAGGAGSGGESGAGVGPPLDGGGGADDTGEWATGQGWTQTLKRDDGRDPVVLVCLADGRNRRQLAEWLTEWVAVRTDESLDALDDTVDLCLLDTGRLERYRETLASHRASVAPVFFPVLAIDTSREGSVPPWMWAFADGVASVPLEKASLRTQLETLLSRRTDTVALARREDELQSALAELRLKQRAMDQAPVGIIVTGPRSRDTPIEYVNDAFLELTGYEREEVLGRNCRFLQGPETDEATVATVREAVECERPVQVDILNYTKQGGQFWNSLTIAPIGGDRDGSGTRYVGFQEDITERKVTEQRLNVKNRLLRHNLRNEMNVISGYSRRLADDESLSEGAEDAVEHICRTSDRLSDLSEEIRRVRSVLDRHSGGSDCCTVAEIATEITAAIGESIRLDVADGTESRRLSGRELATACIETVRVIRKANHPEDAPILVTLDEDDGRIAVEILTEETALPRSEWTALDSGHETVLNHPDRVGLWLARWVLQFAYGNIHVENRGSDVVARLWVPLADADTNADDADHGE